MKHIFTAVISGLVFGLGLLLSGMSNPAKVVGFLDLLGAWDPSLALVMAGAIGVGFFAFAWAKRPGRKAWSGQTIDLPSNQTIDARLIVGGLLFGAGWGLGGFCPGPALVAAAAGSTEAIIFVATMLAGMACSDWLS